MKTDINLIIKRLEECIRDSNLSYAELEKTTKISKSSLQRYATGATKKIPVDIIGPIAEATGVSALWIMGWESLIQDNTQEYISNNTTNSSVYKIAAKNSTPGTSTENISEDITEKLSELVEVASELSLEKIDKLIKMSGII